MGAGGGSQAWEDRAASGKKGAWGIRAERTGLRAGEECSPCAQKNGVGSEG